MWQGSALIRSHWAHAWSFSARPAQWSSASSSSRKRGIYRGSSLKPETAVEKRPCSRVAWFRHDHKGLGSRSPVHLLDLMLSGLLMFLPDRAWCVQSDPSCQLNTDLVIPEPAAGVAVATSQGQHLQKFSLRKTVGSGRDEQFGLFCWIQEYWDI